MESAAITDLLMLPAPLQMGTESRKGCGISSCLVCAGGIGAGKEPIVLG